MKFNEDSRVKIPTILHLIKLGYTYLSLRENKWDNRTNIFPEIFNKSIKKLNPDCTNAEINSTLEEITLLLDNEDLGHAFYNRLKDQNKLKLFDFQESTNNSYHVVTELTYKKDDEEFRPDITLLINGLPLFFIEVKKPNNLDGIQAEHKRLKTRFQNRKFRHFLNLTQLMVFSNNMEYDEDDNHMLQGAFYATTSYHEPGFNYFREEENFDLKSILEPPNEKIQDKVLQDNNLLSIKESAEFRTNKKPETPTNRICTSLFQKERLSFLLQFGFAFVKKEGRLEKHVMRYPQFFATKAIEKKLDEGIRKGIIWHTQGSGKTALAFYNVHFLTEYYRKKSVIPKFYFIVDRIDLLIQASKEFRSRGLVVHNIDSKEDFTRDIKSTSVLHNDSGKTEITVVNIHKFDNDPSILQNTDYQLNIQRIYFLDEVHRSYNPKGSFLASLNESDQNAIKIGLTGTPLLGDDYNSKSLFGGYIHKYYYNASIKDGYTLRLIREEIETSYKLSLKEALEEIEVLKGKTSKEELYAHRKFVEPMLEYIIKDFEKARVAHNDYSIGGMVICDSTKQAKEMHSLFQEKYYDKKKSFTEISRGEPIYSIAAEPQLEYGPPNENKKTVKQASIVLSDLGTKEDREKDIEDFKEGKIDLLFVYNMLLTGFDSGRLKKLYLGRVIKAHNLLQALTRVNRTYKEFKYGYVVDFADIQKEFDKTNQDYFKELQSELGDEIEHYSNLFKTPEEIENEIQQIKDTLLHFETENAEVFSQQISQIHRRSQMLEIVRALSNAKSLFNIIRLTGNYDLLNKLDFRKLNFFLREASNRLQLINTKEALESKVDNTNLLNVALEDVIFAFTKVKEEELVLADKLKNTLQKTRETLGGNFDQQDPEFISLKEELERLFRKKNLTEVTKEEMESNIEALNRIYEKSRELERRNQLLKAKYLNDEKYARLHKRLMEKSLLSESESKLFEALNDLKTVVDKQILRNSKVIENESFIERVMAKMVIEQLKNNHQYALDATLAKQINGLLVKEYLNEFYGRVA
ncbi:type I restriction endonuclease subunit R [Jiulongibacter sediminis]|uniref:type I restriction endonuclease subunit R n=1 Tax=Jiulongibacter sediminis TaxID=1605367 RepID=UPI0026F243D9|nr:type I restriction endonuclease [Jiulongibacter sediminis]